MQQDLFAPSLGRRELCIGIANTVHSSISQLYSYRLLKESDTIIKRSQSTEYSREETLRKKPRTSSVFAQGTVFFFGTHATALFMNILP